MLNFNNIISNNRRISYAYLPRVVLYEDLGDGLDIQIHSQNKRFIECIKDAYERLKKNLIGIRLVKDIRSLRELKKDPCWIVECNKHDADGVKIHPLRDSSFLFKTEDQCADLIYINIEQNFHYYGFYKEDLENRHQSETIPLQKFISDPSELDITLFHEMNHYRHYLQIGAGKYDRQQTRFSKYNDQERQMLFMYSNEELLQLTGNCLEGEHDSIYEILYRAHRNDMPIRYPYKNDEPNEYVQSRATAGYFSDLLTPN